jgi:hypothetical protein
MTDALSDGNIVPLEVPQANPKQVDAIDATKVPFLITASELRDRKNKRRRKQIAPRP